MQESLKVTNGFLKARKDLPIVLQIAKQTLNFIPLLIQFTVIIMRIRAIPFRRNNTQRFNVSDIRHNIIGISGVTWPYVRVGR